MERVCKSAYRDSQWRSPLVYKFVPVGYTPRVFLFFCVVTKGFEMDRDRFFSLLSHLSQEDIEDVINAYWLAKDVHRGQLRDGGERYFEHVRSVALILIGYKRHDKESIILALLHDIIEDTFTPPSVISRLFGESILESILLLSKSVPEYDSRTGKQVSYIKIPDDVYYSRLASASEPVRLVKCADRVHNLSSMGIWPVHRRVEYANHTQKYVIPLASNTSQGFQLLLQAQVDSVLVL